MLQNFVPQAKNLKKYEGLNHFTKVSPKHVQIRKLSNIVFTDHVLINSYGTASNTWSSKI